VVPLVFHELIEVSPVYLLVKLQRDALDMLYFISGECGRVDSARMDRAITIYS